MFPPRSPAEDDRSHTEASTQNLSRSSETALLETSITISVHCISCKYLHSNMPYVYLSVRPFVHPFLSLPLFQQEEHMRILPNDIEYGPIIGAPNTWIPTRTAAGHEHQPCEGSCGGHGAGAGV